MAASSKTYILSWEQRAKDLEEVNRRLAAQLNYANKMFEDLFQLTSGGQIMFPAPQNSSTDPNTLDDYQEGSWTPVIGGAGGTSGQTYALHLGRYIKIGKRVF